MVQLEKVPERVQANGLAVLGAGKVGLHSFLSAGVSNSTLGTGAGEFSLLQPSKLFPGLARTLLTPFCSSLDVRS